MPYSYKMQFRKWLLQTDPYIISSSFSIHTQEINFVAEKLFRILNKWIFVLLQKKALFVDSGEICSVQSSKRLSRVCCLTLLINVGRHLLSIVCNSPNEPRLKYKKSVFLVFYSDAVKYCVPYAYCRHAARPSVCPHVRHFLALEFVSRYWNAH